MPILGRSNHAFFFDGVSDSIVVPQGTMSRLGKETSDGTKSKTNILGEKQHIEGEGTLSGILNSQICIEAWVIPDCGGVVVEKENQFKPLGVFTHHTTSTTVPMMMPPLSTQTRDHSYTS